MCNNLKFRLKEHNADMTKFSSYYDCLLFEIYAPNNQIPDFHYDEEKNTQNEQIIAHFEYLFTCHYSKTIWLVENLNEIKVTH